MMFFGENGKAKKTGGGADKAENQERCRKRGFWPRHGKGQWNRTVKNKIANNIKIAAKIA